jgi:hypothetical protein
MNFKKTYIIDYNQNSQQKQTKTGKTEPHHTSGSISNLKGFFQGTLSSESNSRISKSGNLHANIPTHNRSNSS